MPNLSKFIHYHSNAIESDTYVTPEDEIRQAVTDPKDANLISSEHRAPGSKFHYLMLDLDIPHQYIPSSTEGHGHLIIEKVMHEDTMWKILDMLVKAGILQEAFVTLAKRRGAVFLRHPDHPKKKENDLIEEDDVDILPDRYEFRIPPNLV